MLRVLGFKFGIITLILDVLKGALPTYIALKYGNLFTDPINNGIIVGIFAIFGHTFSLVLKDERREGCVFDLWECFPYCRLWLFYTQR